MLNFFVGKLLKNEEISDLPDPLGNALLYFKGYGFTNPRACWIIEKKK